VSVDLVPAKCRIVSAHEELARAHARGLGERFRGAVPFSRDVRFTLKGCRIVYCWS
jgi:hypothetical protein